MEAEEVQRHLEETGAHQEGHFLLSSGLHSGHYVQCARVLAWPARAALLGSALGERWQDESLDFVVGPAMGGIVIAHEVARYLGTPCMFAERTDGRMGLRRGFSVEAGSRVLVIEDVVTTGKSVREVIAFLEGLRAKVAGVGSILCRSSEPGGPESLFGEIPYHALLTMPFEARPPRECPQCLEGKPFEKPGSRPVAPAVKQDAP